MQLRDDLPQLTQRIVILIGVNLFHRGKDQRNRLGGRLFGGRCLGSAPGLGLGRRLTADDILDQHKAVAHLAQTFGRLGLANANHLQAVLTDARRQPGKVAVRRHQHKAIDLACMQNVHRINHKADIAGILALGIGRLLMHHQPQITRLLFPLAQRLA